jgi:protein-S-isoprenylcysteine O-methyltransferase Ste14
MDSDRNLAAKGIAGMTVTVAVMAALVFLSAWTLRYWQAWLFVATYAACSAFMAADLWKRDRALLKRRMRGGPLAEAEPAQKIIMLVVSIEFILLLVVPGLDHRFGWTTVPPAVSVLGDIIMIVGFFTTLRVLQENSFAASTINVASDQRVISTGPYAVVRHPMYACASLIMLGIPLVLGSYWGVLVFVAMVPVLIWRLLDEEAFLAKNLAGYTQYQSKVRWRLIPGLF